MKKLVISLLAVCLSIPAFASEVPIQDPFLIIHGHYRSPDGRVKERNFPVEFKLNPDGSFNAKIESWIEERLSDGTSELRYFTDMFNGSWMLKNQTITIVVSKGNRYPEITFSDINGLKLLVKNKKS